MNRFILARYVPQSWDDRYQPGNAMGQWGTHFDHSLVALGVNILFTIGGDGTFRGAHAIAEEVERRGLPIAVVAIPKTIDNDIDLIYRCFGFKSAVEIAAKSLECAHIEAKCARGGVGLVKLMGRE